MSVVDDFFENECNDHVRGVVLRGLDTSTATYLTFNVFNVRIEPDLAVVTIEDELDPDREEAMGIHEFRMKLEQTAQ